ncbi:MAG: PAS domain-containing protein [Pseudomonadota bacterium]
MSRNDDGGLQQALGELFGIISFTPDGHVLEYNAAFANVMGLGPRTAVGQHHSNFCAPNYVASKEYREMWASLANGQSFSGTVERRTAQDATIWLRAVYAPVVGEDGRVERVVKYAVDITPEMTELRQARQEATAVSEQFAIIAFDPDGTVRCCNQNFSAATGYSRDQIVGKHHSMFCSEETVQSPEYSKFWQSLAGGVAQQGEYLRRNSQKGDLWLRAVYAPIRDDRGQVTRVIKYASDVTSEKIMQMNVNALVAEALDVVTAMATGDLTSRVEGTYPDHLGEMADRLNQANERLSSIVDSVNDSAGAIGERARSLVSGNKELAARTEEQASSLEETAATMEEMTGAVRSNSETTQQAAQIAAEAAFDDADTVVDLVVGAVGG